jgi:two-component system KDP operon response regulator KdpE
MPPVNCVLVIADDRATVDFLCEALTDEGYIALSATDGASALALIAKHPPALLLVDLWMPEMSGAELIAQLHATGLACFPIVVMSGSPDEPLLADLGISDVLAKPFELDDLLACVARSVPRPAVLQRRPEPSCACKEARAAR